MVLRVRLEHKPRRWPPAERARLGLQWRAFWRIRMADLVQRGRRSGIAACASAHVDVVGDSSSAAQRVASGPLLVDDAL
jgi:hypothetical protein